MEWSCRRCGERNYPSRLACRGCSVSRPNPPLWVSYNGRVCCTFLAANAAFPRQAVLDFFGLEQVCVQQHNQLVYIGDGVPVQDVQAFTQQQGSRMQPIVVVGAAVTRNFLRVLLPGASSVEQTRRALLSTYDPQLRVLDGNAGNGPVQAVVFKRLVHENKCARASCTLNMRENIVHPVAPAPATANCKHWFYLDMARLILEGMVLHGADPTSLRLDVETMLRFPSVEQELHVTIIPDGCIRISGLSAVASNLVSVEGKAARSDENAFLTAVTQGYDFCAISLSSESEWDQPWEEGTTRFSLAWSGDHLQLLWMVVEGGRPRTYWSRIFAFDTVGTDSILGPEGLRAWNAWMRDLVQESRKPIRAPPRHKGVKASTLW